VEKYKLEKLISGVKAKAFSKICKKGKGNIFRGLSRKVITLTIVGDWGELQKNSRSGVHNMQDRREVRG